MNPALNVSASQKKLREISPLFVWPCFKLLLTFVADPRGRMQFLEKITK